MLGDPTTSMISAFTSVSTFGRRDGGIVKVCWKNFLINYKSFEYLIL